MRKGRHDKRRQQRAAWPALDVGTTALAVGALGVVYGDIGPSPLYSLRECLLGSHGVPPSRFPESQDTSLGRGRIRQGSFDA